MTPISNVDTEVKFWMVDPLDVDHVIKDLLIFGYSVRGLAEEECREISDSPRLYEVRIRPVTVSD